MSFEEVLEMNRIISTSIMNENKVGRLNELLEKAMNDSREEGIRLAISSVKDQMNDSVNEKKFAALYESDLDRIERDLIAKK